MIGCGFGFRDTTTSCGGFDVEEAKAQTLINRAKLRGYVTAGGDESVNDPVINDSYRPHGAASGAGEAYFAAECAVRKCAGGGGTAQDDRNSEGEEEEEEEEDEDNSEQDSEPPPATPQQSQSESEYFTLTVCNRLKVTISVAIAGRRAPGETKGWVEGWWRVAPNDCRSIGRFPKPYMYIHAVDQRGKKYNGPATELCVEEEVFKIGFKRGPQCAEHLRRGFYEMKSLDDDFTWTLG